MSNIKQTFKYGIHDTVASISNKNYYIAFNPFLLFSDLSFGLVPIVMYVNAMPVLGMTGN